MTEPTRHLILMRHGEAVAKTPDEDRVLTREGIRQVRHVAGQLLAQSLVPDLVLCSGVLRTRQTLQILAEILPISPEQIVDCQKGFYKAQTAQDVLRILEDTIPPESARVLVIGHNPGMFLTAGYLGSHHINRNSSIVTQGYPTSTASVFQVSGMGWPSLTPAQCLITDILSGAELPRPQSGFNLTRS